jgi:2,4-didehydro-3-deoxy-L-rhamnonate hydrolase
MPHFWAVLHSSLARKNDVVTMPPVGEQHDWDIEFDAILCGTGRCLNPNKTENIIAGYAMVNDLGTLDD